MLSRSLLRASDRGRLQYVGSSATNIAPSTSTNTTLSLTALTEGIGTAAQAGDLVVAVYGVNSTAAASLSITDGTTDYTLIGSALYANDTYDANLRVAYKYLTAADTSVTFGPTGTTSNVGACIAHVWRGVSASTPLDVAATAATGTNTGRPNPAAITPATQNAKILVAASSADSTTVALAASYLSGFKAWSGYQSKGVMVAIGYVDWTSGAYDPAVFTGGPTSTSDSWCAVTFALRPA